MTPKQKKQRKNDLAMCRFLGLTGYTKYSNAHLRTIIERRKLDILNELGIDLSNGLDHFSSDVIPWQPNSV